MYRPTTTRRRLLAAGGTTSLAALSGCSGLLGDDSGGDSSDSNGGESGGDLDAVPAGTEFLVTVDVQRLLNDGLFAQRLREMGETDDVVGDVPTLDGLLMQVESEFGLDPRGLSTALLFATASGEGSAGAVIQADWSETEIREALAAQGTVESTSHQGQTVYETPDAAIGVLPGRGYVVGQSGAVGRSIDAATGNAPSVDNATVTAYERAPDGYIQAAFAPSAETTESVENGGVVAASELQYGAGALYRGGGTRGGEMVMQFDSADAAEKTAAAAEEGLAQFRSERGPGAGLPPEMSEQLEQLFEETTISQDDTAVAVEVAGGDGWLLLVLAAVAGTFVLGLGSQRGTRVPNAAFEFDYDAGAGAVTITHTSGDAIPADQLVVRGGSLSDSWLALGGSASGTASGGPAVFAGDSLTVGVEPGTRIELLWESPDTSAVLATYDVPG